MKKFTKLFLSCAAVAALSAAIGVSAMAADSIRSTDGITGSYEAGVLTVTAPTALDSAQKTIIVLAPADSADAADWTALAADDIIGIDQNGTITEVKLNADNVDTANKTYIVAMGGNGTVYLGEFGKETATGTQIIIGDVNNSSKVDGNDASAILRKLANKTTLTGEVGEVYNLAAGGTIIIGDVNSSSKVDGNDASAILRKLANKTTLTGSVGESATVTTKVTQ